MADLYSPQSSETDRQGSASTFDWLDLGAFDIIGTDSHQIPLEQVSKNRFRLRDGVSLRYKKKTGLDKMVAQGKLDADVHEQIRTVNAEQLGVVDLASVPGPLRWFSNTYGPHTPAALFHDWLIPDQGVEPIMAEEFADRYFRYMLGAVGVPRFKRYVMWAATAFRTRWASKSRRKRILAWVWAGAATVGSVIFLNAMLDLAFGAGMIVGSAWPMLIVSGVAPFVASALWGRQFGAGIVAALAAFWIIPPAILAAAGYLIYLAIEKISTVAFGGVDSDDRVDGVSL